MAKRDPLLFGSRFLTFELPLLISAFQPQDNVSLFEPQQLPAFVTVTAIGL